MRRLVAALGVLAIGGLGLVAAAPATAHHRDADQTARITALEARLTSLEARVASLELSATPGPTAAPSATPTPAPTTGVTQLVAGDITTSGTYALNRRAVTSVNIRADNVTITGPGRIDFLRLYGVAGFRLTGGVEFGAGNETPIVLRPRADGRSVRDAVFEDFRVDQTGAPANGVGYSAVSTGPDGPQPHDGVTFRRFALDTRGIGWGGLEIWNTRNLVVEDGTFVGGCRPGAAICSFVSPPRSDGVIVRRNTFDFRAGGWWGVELADVDDAQLTDNIVLGPDLFRRRAFAWVEINPGSGSSDRARITGNRVTGIWNFVNANGAGHVITDNCLNDVASFAQYGPWTGPVTIERNGPCA